jgi:AraC-like DNA-binding protein
MMPIQEKISRQAETSFKLARRNSRGFGFEWHQHPECELTLIEAGTGQRFVGDHIDTYRPGDLVLLGSDLPHTWASHPEPTCRHKAVVVQFDTGWLESLLASTPEARAIQGLMRRGRRGLRFTGPAQAFAAERLPKMTRQRGMERVLSLIALLDKLAHSRAAKPLASPAYEQAGYRVDSRIDRVCCFIHDHVTEPITQADAAALVHMSGPAFSRFFRQRVGMTYSRYVHELRIGHACRLLLESDISVTEACYSSGFNNLSNFNRIFRSLKGVSPREYRSRHARHST